MAEREHEETERSDDPGAAAAGMDAAAFARAGDDEEGREAGLAGGAGDLGAGGDLAGDRGGLGEAEEEGRTA